MRQACRLRTHAAAHCPRLTAPPSSLTSPPKIMWRPGHVPERRTRCCSLVQGRRAPDIAHLCCSEQYFLALLVRTFFCQSCSIVRHQGISRHGDCARTCGPGAGAIRTLLVFAVDAIALFASAYRTLAAAIVSARELGVSSYLATEAGKERLRRVIAPGLQASSFNSGPPLTSLCSPTSALSRSPPPAQSLSPRLRQTPNVVVPKSRAPSLPPALAPHRLFDIAL
ncbi:uncharacterized protein LAESUDRAFT_392406 [Laetiporus sulphureus 93-53]|uniref:Uncharacterized protein n=1 Tax=Laetiporus sulphureus 93-53 TaxID=1314785 RepID=A0A165CHU2_9APHY|nr:uncharacterized protein LAESUDRAFT_392406 [Laetiporus sulphureus 93-53]KZT02843.1 hypothetical protein LAESUDRAFT_392406 [Laetiporus sulphureus 93-53]